MLQPGDIVVERLTGRRAIVIHVAGPEEEITLRFPNGRLEDRYVFELEPPIPFLSSLLWAVFALFTTPVRGRPAASVGERARPMLVRTSTSTPS